MNSEDAKARRRRRNATSHLASRLCGFAVRFGIRISAFLRNSDFGLRISTDPNRLPFLLRRRLGMRGRSPSQASIEPVAQAEDWMLPEHARAGVTHDYSDLLPPGGLIAMHGTFDTNRLFRAEVAALQPDAGIILQASALGAKRCPRGVMATAVTANHRRNRLPFPGKTLVGKARAGCLAWLDCRAQSRGPDGLWTGHR